MLEFKNVTKKYGKNIAIENINFTVEDGEFVFIVGSSGAGKSTITRLLINKEQPTEGKILFNGIDISRLKGNKLALMRRQIGMVFQDFKLLQQKTVYENIAFVLEVARESKVNTKKKVAEVLELVGLTEKAKKFPAELSGGEQQRVAIARALVNDPVILIADEPTGNLDATNGWDIFQLINKVNNWGTTVLVVTHDNEIVDSLQKRVIRLEKGRVIRDSIGGYTQHKDMEKAQEEYLHSDKYPDPGETEKEYAKRTKISAVKQAIKEAKTTHEKEDELEDNE
jgi:cell division transport system ATP-binding protein